MLCRLAIVVCVCAFGLVACGPGAPAAPDATVCQARASYGAVTPTNASATGSGSGSAEIIQYEAAIDTNSMPDVIDIELYAGQGDFATSTGMTIVSGTYDLSRNGDDNYATCGVCLQLWAAYDTTITNGSDPVGSYYVANGGSVTITSVEPMVTGTATDLTFRHVDFTFDDMGAATSETDDGDHCLARVGSISFTSAVTM